MVGEWLRNLERHAIWRDPTGGARANAEEIPLDRGPVSGVYCATRFPRLAAPFALALLLSLPAAAPANPLGDLTRYSEIPANDNGAAYYPDVEFNAGTSEYLATFDADSIFGPGEDEVYVQRISKTGAQIGADHRVSTIGPEGDTTRETFSAPAVAADPVNKRNLVVWASDHKDGTELEVYGQLLDAAGNEIGTNDFSISGANLGTYYPEVAFNPGSTAQGDEEYLVVWTGQVKVAPVQWAQRLDENGAKLGSSFQFSSPAQSGNGSLPRIAYNTAAGEYLVVWYSFKPGEDPEAYGQRISAAGAEIGGDIRLTTTGTVADDKKVYDPAIAYNPPAGNYLLTFMRNETAPNPALTEVHSQVLSATAVPQGTPLRLSAAGKRATDPRASYATSGGGAGQHLVVWAQDSPPPGFADSEIWGRRVKFDGTALADPFQLFASEEAFTTPPTVAARSDAIEWLSVWSSDCPRGSSIPPQDVEVMGRRVDAGTTPSGDGVCKLPGVDPQPTPTPTPTPTPAPGGNSQPPGGTNPPPVVTPPPAAPPKLKAKDVLRLPSTKKCVSRRKFRIRLRTPRGTRIVRATVKLNGKRVKTVKGKRLTAAVDLRGLPKGRFKVAIEIRTADGRKVTATRRYRTCAPRRKT